MRIKKEEDYLIRYIRILIRNSITGELQINKRRAYSTLLLIELRMEYEYANAE